jgi:hypothetical protein
MDTFISCSPQFTLDCRSWRLIAARNVSKPATLVTSNTRAITVASVRAVAR